MFGYIKPYVPDLTVYEYNLYKAFYCGLCRKIGKVSRARTRLTLSYDYVFPALLLAAAHNERVQMEKGGCPAHPVKKRYFIKSGDCLDKTARSSVILGYYKAVDDIEDGDNPVRARYAKSLYSSKINKDESTTELAKNTGAGLKKISEFEKERTFSPSIGADLFGDVLSGIFSFGEENEEIKRILKEVGRRIGRWIYLIDAADDFKEDVKKGRYNPFGNYDILPADDIFASLEIEQKSAAVACELIDCNDNHIMNIIFNILTAGMTFESNRVLHKNDTGEEK